MAGHDRGGPSTRPTLGWIALGTTGLIAATAPAIASALGVELNVAGDLEIADHVVPGAIVVAASAAGATVSASASRAPAVGFASASLALLAGLWMTTTHVPLLFDLERPDVPVGGVLVHSVPGIVVLALAGYLLVARWRADQRHG